MFTKMAIMFTLIERNGRKFDTKILNSMRTSRDSDSRFWDKKRQLVLRSIRVGPVRAGSL